MYRFILCFKFTLQLPTYIFRIQHVFGYVKGYNTFFWFDIDISPKKNHHIDRYESFHTKEIL